MEKEQKTELLGHIKKAQNEDQESFELLKKKYTPLIEACSRKHVVEGMNSQDVEDLRQEALVNFYRAVCSYDCDAQGVEFGLYAKICIDNGLVSFVRTYLRGKRRVTVPLDDGDNAYDPASAQEDFLQSVIDSEKEAELVRTVKKHLSNYENRIWWLYVSGKSVSEIAAEIDAPSAKSVSNAIYRIRKKLRFVVGNIQST
ncbi:MAG: sigma-70 family RNA polymerase sigma factor [Ruminococcaceae bacterium]|nr:sigma-70 family RNA polymerase sigma factor [Oscillospiraceae bacterium]